MSLRVRINLVITLVTIAFTAVMVHVILNDLRSSVREEIESTTRVAVQLVETVVTGVFLEPGPAERTEALLALLRRVGHVRANDIRFYDGSGKLLYQSPASTYRAGRRAPEWFSALVQPEVAEARLTLPGGTIVVTPDASRSIVEAWDDLKGFALLALAFLLLVNAAVFWLLERALKPLPQILDGLAQLTRGRFNVRLPGYRAAEFDAISRGFNRMAQALDESLAENRQLALVAQQSSDAIIIRDLAGRITYCNAAAQRLLGYPRQELVGAAATLIVPAERHDELRMQLESIERREPVELLETQRVAKDGRVVDVALSAAPLVDPASDRVIGEICSLRDITEHKRMQAAERELEQNRRLTALIQSRLEAERRALARELHDELAQYVTAIKTIGTDEARDVRHRRRVALIRAMQEALAAFPVGEGRARLHAVVRIAAGDEAFVDHDLRRLEAGVDVTIAPFLRRLTGRQLVIARGRKVARFPFQRLQVDLGRGDVAVRACVGAARKEALERIGDVGKLLEVDFDHFDRFGGRSLAFGRNREDWLPYEQHFFLGQDRGLRRRELRDVVGRQDAEHARHLDNPRRVDAADARVRNRARQCLAERHALRTKILGVFGPAGKLWPPRRPA